MQPGQGLAPGQGLHSGQGPQHGLPPGQPMPGTVQPQGLGRQASGLGSGTGQNGLVPMDPQRAAQQRQNPAGGLQYPPDRVGQFGGQAHAGQYGAPYAPAPYGGLPQPAPVSQPPAAISVGDAVQSAHAEGFGFGEAVARDAPALWLEAVLARKPRMPSDLEARLLQGSALPIDSLLHDEVRHALRRGFWDALERSRR